MSTADQQAAKDTRRLFAKYWIWPALVRQYPDATDDELMDALEKILKAAEGLREDGDVTIR